MRRFTTPTHIFTLPFETEIIKAARVVYAQSEEIILAKGLSECALEGNTVTVRLTQEETAKFDCKKNYVEIQMHLLDTEGNSLVSQPLKVAVEKCLDSEVLS